MACIQIICHLNHTKRFLTANDSYWQIHQSCSLLPFLYRLVSVFRFCFPFSMQVPTIDFTFPVLNTLSIIKCTTSRIDLNCSGLEFLTLQNCKLVSSITLDCPRLSSFVVSECGDVTTIHAITWAARSVRFLDLRKLSEAFVEGVEVLTVVVNRCSRMSTLDLGCPKLTNLELYGCWSMHEAFFQKLPGAFPRLSHLVLPSFGSTT